MEPSYRSIFLVFLLSAFEKMSLEGPISVSEFILDFGVRSPQDLLESF